MAASVRTFADLDRESFAERVRDEATTVKRLVEQGQFDNATARVGLEYEFYGSDDRGRLAPLTRRLIDSTGFECEVGRHQAELQTRPQPLNAHGLRAQEEELRARIGAAHAEMLDEDVRLVSDGLWTVPPAGETGPEYLLAGVTEDGIDLARNVSREPRYHAQANSAYSPALRLEAPHVDDAEGTVLLNSLGSAIQPHYQLASATALPRYFRYALRLAGPLLALGVNSPFFPPGLYEDEVAAGAVLDDSWLGNRISVFESVMNPTDRPGSVRFPRDVDTVADAIDRVVEDEPVVPRTVEAGERFDDRFAHFRYKHGTFWRWVRPVFDGRSRAMANARIEFRPIPAQPTIRDSMAFLVAFAGLLEGLVAADHPLEELAWERARQNFYDAARDGLDADLHWIDAEGNESTRRDIRHAELFEYARLGLEATGLAAQDAERWLTPLRVRASREVTPAQWKRERVRQRIEDGAGLGEAIEDVQRTFIRNQRETFVDGEFSEWLSP